MTDILTLARENGFSHIGFANMAAHAVGGSAQNVLCRPLRKMERELVVSAGLRQHRVCKAPHSAV